METDSLHRSNINLLKEIIACSTLRYSPYDAWLCLLDPASRCYPEAAPHFEPPIQMVLLGQQDNHIQLALYALPHLRFGYTQPLNRRWREAITPL